MAAAIKAFFFSRHFLISSTLANTIFITAVTLSHQRGGGREGGRKEALGDKEGGRGDEECYYGGEREREGHGKGPLLRGVSGIYTV